MTFRLLAAPAPASAESKGTGVGEEPKTLTVLVLDAQNEKPISGATVQHYNQTAPIKPVKFSTDTAGKATVQLPAFLGPQFWFSVTVSHPDYAARAVQWATYMQDNPASFPAEYTIKLGKGITIGGFLKEETGAPIRNGKVFLNAYYNTPQPQRETPVLPPTEEIKLGAQFTHVEVTDDNGRWTCPHWPEGGGNLYLRGARPNGSFANFTTWRTDYVDFSSRRDLVQMNDLLATNATLTLKRGITVSGIVVDPQGRPVKGAQLAEGYGSYIDVASKIVTGDDGLFKFENRAKREMVLTVQADGYAITSTIVAIQPDMPEVRVPLGPQRPLRARVTNGDNEALAGADVRIEPHATKAQILDWETKTDRNGRFEWAAAPEKPVVFMINASNYPPRKVTLTSGPAEHLIRIRKENKDQIRITGKVVAVETKQPIEKFTVNNTQEYGNLSLSAEGSKGEFSLEVRPSNFAQGYGPGFKLRIVADGYAPFVTDQMEFLEGDRTLEIALKKGEGGLTGLVRLPNGEPAADAKIFLTAADGQMYSSIYSHRAGEFTRQGAGVSGKAGEDGRFSLPVTAGEPKNVVITHDEGLLR